MKDQERDILRRTILELLATHCVHYTDLNKKVCASCHTFATTNTFRSQLRYLLNNHCIARISRGIYQITPKGKNYLLILES
jgi:DNA-binding PadR family transcriptional regulator